MQTIDQNVLIFLTESRTEWLSFLMLIITYCGSYVIVSGLTFLSALSFYIHKHYSRILALLISISGSATTVYLIKHIFYRARPLTEAFYLETSSSFPSGHMTMAMALYGFIFYVIWKHDHHYIKKIFLWFLGILVILVGISRLYLGVHYLSDVLAGFVIGFVWILISHSIVKLKFWHLQDNEHL